MALHHYQHMTLQSASDITKAVLQRIDAFVFPRLCFICDAPGRTPGNWFCPECEHDLTCAIKDRTACPRCGQNNNIRSCTCTIAWDYPFTAIHSFLDYSDTVQAIMQLVKYRGMRNLALYMGQFCAQTTTHADLFNDIDCLIPIPLHRKRLRKRGYNQAEWFARGIQHIHPHIPTITNVLERTRDTKTQTSLDRQDRQDNVEHAFSIIPEAAPSIAGKQIMLVDDVITTGATTAAATRALLTAGCKGVTVLSLARD